MQEDDALDLLLTRSQIVIFQHIECGELPRIHSLQAEYLYRRSGKPALRRLGRAFHE